jgi:hypothetical protein
LLTEIAPTLTVSSPENQLWAGPLRRAPLPASVLGPVARPRFRQRPPRPSPLGRQGRPALVLAPHNLLRSSRNRARSSSCCCRSTRASRFHCCFSSFANGHAGPSPTAVSIINPTPNIGSTAGSKSLPSCRCGNTECRQIARRPLTRRLQVSNWLCQTSFGLESRI